MIFLKAFILELARTQLRMQNQFQVENCKQNPRPMPQVNSTVSAENKNVLVIKQSRASI